MGSDVTLDGADGFPLPDVPGEAVRAFSHPRRRAAVTVLRRADGRLATTELATRVVARTAATPSVEVSRSERDPVLVSLRHRHLPRLDDYGAVDWDRTGSSVALADDRPLADARLETLLAVCESDALRSVCGSERRRTVLAVLADEGTTAVADLAREVAAREGDDRPVDESAARRVRASLYHAHLPAMDAAGALEYDEATETVSPSALPSIPR